MEKQHWQDWVTAIVGVALLLTPLFTLLFVATAAPTGIVAMNFYITGLLALGLGVAALSSYAVWEEIVDMVLGLWLVISPWFLGFSANTALTVMAIAGGVVIIAAAGWTLVDEQSA